jgi:Flp pilus assembly protein TadB
MEEEQRSTTMPTRRRERHRQQVDASASKDKDKQPARRSSLPWWMKLSIAAVLLLVSLVGGLITGFSIKGTGEMHQVFDPNTYIHMYNLVFKAE